MTQGVKALKRYRFENNLTQIEFCEKFNFNRSTLACIESGTNKPKVDTAKELGKIIGAEWSLFFEEEEK